MAAEMTVANGSFPPPGEFMKLFSITSVASLFLVGASVVTAQIAALEKQALSFVQRLPASQLDSQLSGASFGDWLKQTVGPQAGVLWQLADCADAAGPQSLTGDSSACVEAIAALADGRKVNVLIQVGTFKKGLSDKPNFLAAAIEQDDELYPVRQLHALPNLLRDRALLRQQATALPPLSPPPAKAPATPALSIPPRQPEQETPPPPPASTAAVSSSTISSSEPKSSNSVFATAPGSTQNAVQRVSQGVLQGRAISRVKPPYPSYAKQMNADGAVVVLVLISENGRVADAKIVSGHPALRNVTLDAARQWTFEPTKLNGIPVRTQGTLTFLFKPDNE